MSTLVEESEWIKGPEFARFLRERDVTDMELPNGGPQSSDRITRWEAGTKLSVWKADRILTHLGYSLHMLDESCFYPVGYSPHSQKEKSYA